MTALLNIFTIINLTLLGGILFFKKNGSVANKMLGLIIFIPATTFAFNYLLYIGVLDKYPIFLFIPLQFLWAPLVLWYVRLMLGEEVKVNFKRLIHFVPYSIHFLCLVLLYFKNDTYRQEFLTGIFHGNFPWQLMAFNFALLLQTSIYLAYSYLKIKSYIKNYKDLGIEEDRILAKVRWLRFFIYILIGLNLTAIIIASIVPMETCAFLFTPLLYDVAFYIVIVGAIRNSTLFSAAGFENYMIKEKENKEKYFNSSLQEPQIEEIHQKLLSHFKEDKPYLKSDLNIKCVSDNLALRQHHLSQVINQKFNMNFFDFINYSRVEEAKIKLKNIKQTKLTIEGIGTECGFGSASAFYRAFKKNTGFTPSQFTKQP